MLHGKIASLVRPYAVIRRVVGVPGQELGGEAVEGDAEEEESGEEDEDEREDNTPAKNRARNKDDEDEEDESPLFAPTPALLPIRPNHRRSPNSSSPIYPPSAVRDYSSELDMASPARERDNDDVGFKRSWDDEDDDEDDEGERKKLKVEGLVRRKKVKKEGERERTRHYEVIGLVRKKVVFALRWVHVLHRQTAMLLSGASDVKADRENPRPEPIVTATVLPV